MGVLLPPVYNRVWAAFGIVLAPDFLLSRNHEIAISLTKDVAFLRPTSSNADRWATFKPSARMRYLCLYGPNLLHM